MTIYFNPYLSARPSLKKRLLRYFFLKPEASYYLREIAALLRSDPANLSRELGRLEREGIFKSAMRGNQKHFALNRDYPLYRELKALISKSETGSSPMSFVRKRKSVKSARNKVYVIAGARGSGKTIFARKFLREFIRCRHFVNLDLIAGGLSPLAPYQDKTKAEKIMQEQIQSCVKKKTDFGLETMLVSVKFVSLLKRLKTQGYQVHIFYLWVPNEKLAKMRLKQDVIRGARERVPSSGARDSGREIRNILGPYRRLADSWTVLESNALNPHLIAAESKGIPRIIDDKLFRKIKKDCGAGMCPAKQSTQASFRLAYLAERALKSAVRDAVKEQAMKEERVAILRSGKIVRVPARKLLKRNKARR